MRARTRRLLFWLAVLVVIAVVGAITNALQPEPTTAGPTTPLLTQLASLRSVDGETPGYERDAYGSGWKDPDRNGCDARNDILARDLIDITVKPGTGDCVVLAGTLHDPYSGTTIAFIRGNDTSDDVQIDHVVPLSWAWSRGAAGWTDDERVLFANDPVNLRAVDGPTNGSKSDSGPGEWMPPEAGYACTYVESFLTVLVAYDLGVDDLDRAAMRDTLSGCGNNLSPQPIATLRQ